MNKDDLNEARTNPDFLIYLEAAMQNSIKNQNIEMMYEILDTMLVLDLEEEKTNKIYDEILKVASKNLEEKLEKNELLKLENSDFLTIRAFYELAIEKWSNSDFELAKALFFTLANGINDEFLKKNMEVLLVNLSKELDFEDFYEEFVDKDELESKEEYGYFITSFNFDVDDFLKNHQEFLQKEYENLKHLIEKRK
ncbi:hypothetical protein AN286_04050 [Aliarcobacter cryaerophilus ATCC 43158]|uniref:DUF4375 domain-containing protein n=1 Tax=Aliarcobacter cryaerophilus ATCC 43158 TaxID=1032070 RepID=A0AAD0TS00_9BACT|nr:hypothetical protein [Aliarcobacter cryaerophilus]AYJ79349.1 hypothetical protein ACRYA_0185 [Aliarcobacter cryaerophilus ATCC 43158]PRM98002.1 hypothetical protein CJ667_04140 [Aliarcobacter cryaerophilus]QCZ23610.1 hypothetical protein AN286_04050 [Aliarcobacter cryaerophilus ATCC 43158]